MSAYHCLPTPRLPNVGQFEHVSATPKDWTVTERKLMQMTSAYAGKYLLESDTLGCCLSKCIRSELWNPEQDNRPTGISDKLHKWH